MKRKKSHGGKREGAGRPKDPNARDQVLCLRLTKSEMKKIRLAGPTSWARTILLAAADRLAKRRKRS